MPDRIEYLGRCWDDASKNTNTVHMFLALDCELRGQQKLERLEAAAGLEVLLMPFDRVAQALDSGDIAAMFRWPQVIVQCEGYRQAGRE